MTAYQRVLWWAVAVAAVPVAVFWSEHAPPLQANKLPWELIWLVPWATAEEIVFRGGVQHALLQRKALATPWLGISTANLITSLVFSAAHLLAHSVSQSIAVFPVSLLLGLAYEQSSGLRLPIALHVWFNVSLVAARWAAGHSA